MSRSARPEPRRAAALALALLLLAPAAACGGASTRDGAPPAEAPPFAGRWVSTLDGSVLELTAERYYLSFPYQGRTRELFGEIVSWDADAGHILIRYTKALEDGELSDFGDPTIYMTYVIEGDAIRKRVERSGYPAQPDFETYRFERPLP